MSDTIKVDYDSTLKTAQEMRSVHDLVSDANSRCQSAADSASSLEGQAVKKAKESIDGLISVLSDAQDLTSGLDRFFIGAAELFTFEDGRAAKEIEASWLSTP